MVTLNSEFAAQTFNGSRIKVECWWMAAIGCADLKYIYPYPVIGEGICAPVRVTDHTYLFWVEKDSHSNTRSKKGLVKVQPHDAIWGSDVPAEHKLWSDGEKVILSVLPQMGVGKLLLHMQTVNYQMGLFLDATTAALRAQLEEMSALRLMTLQNRMVLDLLVAPQGGVCTMINTSCCTYIPDESQDGHDVPDALEQLQ